MVSLSLVEPVRDIARPVAQTSRTLRLFSSQVERFAMALRKFSAARELSTGDLGCVAIQSTAKAKDEMGFHRSWIVLTCNRHTPVICR
jgi:hypothetical protein